MVVSTFSDLSADETTCSQTDVLPGSIRKSFSPSGVTGWSTIVGSAERYGTCVISASQLCLKANNMHAKFNRMFASSVNKQPTFY